jgi:hypothetical protein
VYLLTADTDEHAAAAARIRVSPTRVVADQLGRISGRTTRSTSSRRISVRVANYAQYAGVQPGLNKLHLRVRTQSGPAPVSVAVLRDTGLGVTRASPYELALRAPERRTTVRPNTRVGVPFRLTRRGGRPDGPVAVHLDPSEYGIRVIGPSTIRYPYVGAGRRGRFVVEAGAPRGYELVLSVPGRYNEPQARVVLVAAPVRSDVNWSLAVGLVAGSALVALGLRLRRRFPC